MVAAGAAAAVTAVALLGGMGVIPVPGSSPRSGADVGAASKSPATASADASANAAGAATQDATGSTQARTAPVTQPVHLAQTQQPLAAKPTAVPDDSGAGRRIVFSIPEQRVWLVDGRGRTISTYLVSGSLTDNLKPGSYAVYSRSRWANGIQDSGVMQYFVRFTRGQNAAIGFHSIPTKNGVPLQTARQLGTPQSHGCIRQRLDDAIRLWDFAPVGTKVVVV